MSIIDRLLLTYREPGRKWHNASYLWLGIKEFRRIMGNHPPRDLTLAWAYHAYVLRDLDASAVAMLHDCRDLGFTLEEADRYVSPLITNCRTRHSQLQRPGRHAHHYPGAEASALSQLCPQNPAGVPLPGRGDVAAGKNFRIIGDDGQNSIVLS